MTPTTETSPVREETTPQEPKEAPKYPIAEIFQSIQGEGRWAGTPMLFIRFAGCTVGKPYAKAERQALELKVYQEKCTDWAGNEFSCDTNYKLSSKMTVDALATLIKEYSDDRDYSAHIVFTGGEPLMHNLTPLVDALIGDNGCLDSSTMLHIETSGTIDIQEKLPSLLYEAINLLHDQLWLTVSPKQGFLPKMLMIASEIKILVDHGFDADAFEKSDLYQLIAAGDAELFFQPVNFAETLDRGNVEKCVALCHRFPRTSLSIQLHKILGVR